MYDIIMLGDDQTCLDGGYSTCIAPRNFRRRGDPARTSAGVQGAHGCSRFLSQTWWAILAGGDRVCGRGLSARWVMGNGYR